MSEPTTPLMQQYNAVKTRYPHALLLFRLGDFYELFYEDAILAARELQITLTSRNREKGQPIPMCGVPYHAADGYIARLIRNGFKSPSAIRWKRPAPAKSSFAAKSSALLRPARPLMSPCSTPAKTIFSPLFRKTLLPQLSASRSSISLPENFRPPNFAAHAPKKPSAKNSNSFTRVKHFSRARNNSSIPQKLLCSTGLAASKAALKTGLF